MTHTPGSWHVGKPYGRKKIIIPVYPATPTLELLVIAHVHTSEANALLIAAAPELLAAAKLVTESVWADEPCPLVHDDDDPCWLDLMKAAIAKAEGANE